LKIAALSNHAPKFEDADCDSSDANLVKCNLEVYTAAATLASQNGAQLVVYPEAYSLSNIAYLEPLVTLGDNPCEDAKSALISNQAIATKTLSCLAAQLSITLATNIFMQAKNGNKYIVDVVFDGNGVVSTMYIKHQLFPNELLAGYKPGPYNPTVFDFEGHRIGCIICYEGVYPEVSGDWSQMDDLKAMGADVFMWQVAGGIPLQESGEGYSNKYNVSFVASEAANDAVIIGPQSRDLGVEFVKINLPGYRARNAGIVMADIDE